MSNSNFIKNNVKSIFTEYQKFMNISVPIPIKIEIFSMSEDAIKNDIFGVPASYHYDFLKDSHELKIWEKFSDERLNFSYLIFHELTHAYDTDRYAKKNKSKYAKVMSEDTSISTVMLITLRRLSI